MDSILRHARLGFRRLVRTPGFSFVVLLTLGLGIGANTAIFSVVNAVLLRPLPYAEPDRLVVLHHHYPSLDLEAPLSAPRLRQYSTELRSFSGVAATTGWGANLTGDGDPERLTAMRSTPSFFRTLGVEAAIGRVWGEDVATGDARVAVLSDGLWRRRFGADPSVVGRTLELNGEPYVVIGVTPADFRDPFQRSAELWAPLVLDEEAYGSFNEYLSTVARLAGGVDETAAQTELTAFAERLKAEAPESLPGDWGILGTSLQELSVREVRPALMVLLGAVVFVLLIACANVANLLLARSSGRRREVALRMAIGAGRREILGQLVVDGLVLGVLGALVGAGFGAAGLAGLKAATVSTVPRLAEVGLDGTVLGATLGVALLVGLLVGLAPALGTLRVEVQSALRDGTRGGTERAGLAVRRMFVVSQFALALTLLAGAGLLMKSMARLQAVDPGFEAGGLLTFHLSLPATRYPEVDQRRAFFDGLLAELEGVPGVEAVGSTTVLPFSGGWSTGSFEVEGYQPADGEPNPWGDVRIVSPGFHEAMGIPLQQGRALEASDGPDAPQVVVVDDVLARRYFPDGDAVGGRIRFGGDWLEIVGVVGHAAHEGLDAEARVQVYGSYRQIDVGQMFVAARARTTPASISAGVRDAVRRLDPSLPMARTRTMEAAISESVGQRRASMVLLGVFAAVALLLAATGVYGVMAQAVGQRTRELGVRMAMGADRRTVLGLVMRQGMGLAVVGVVLGLLGAWGLTRLIRSQLYETDATDPAVFGGVTAVLLVVAVVATLVPAWRATRVDPVDALRQE